MKVILIILLSPKNRRIIQQAANMEKLIPSSFYQSQNVVDISKKLLGKYLVTNIDTKLCVGKIVETEAYRAPDDKACHAYNNKRTARTETMFLQGGLAYVYLCYGIHNLFNVVTAPEGAAHAVLIRALEPVDGIEFMMERRNLKNLESTLTNGPGKLTAAMGIQRTHNGSSLFDNNSIWIEDRGDHIKNDEMIESPRVGIGYSAECSNWPWRFRIEGNPWTSKPDLVTYDL
jgi:DNA-3-methyladenine glycosylase